MSVKKSAIIAIGASVLLIAASSLFVIRPWRTTPTLESTIESMGFVPLSPPSTLVKPGVLVVVASRDPLELDLVCSAEGSLGYVNEWEFLSSETISVTTHHSLDGDFALELDAASLLGSSHAVSAVSGISVVLTNTRILSISDEDVFTRLGSRRSPCSEALQFRQDKGHDVTMIRSVLVADARFVVRFKGDSGAQLRTDAIDDLAMRFNGKMSGSDSSVVVGEQLYWGVRDDPDLANISLSSPTGTSDTPSLLSPRERVRSIRLEPSVQLDVKPILQPSPNSCWAAAGAILANWQNASSLTAAEYAESLGEPWRTVFNTDAGLALGSHREFAQAAGLESLAPQNITILGYTEILREFGPLWVATVGPPGFSAHARVLVAVYGDGTPHSTEMEFIDPRNGARHREPFLAFLESFEREARVLVELDENADFRWQMLRLP